MDQNQTPTQSPAQSPAQTNIINFTKRLIELEKQKKIIQEDIKELKSEFKEEGVPVQIVTRVLNQIKREKRQSEGEINEENIIKEWLLNNTDIDDGVGDLVAK